MTPFFERVEDRMWTLHTCLVLGVDPHPDDLPEPTGEAALAWSLDLLEKAGPHAVAVKPNAAFFEALPGGTEALRRFVEACEDRPTQLTRLVDVIEGREEPPQ